MLSSCDSDLTNEQELHAISNVPAGRLQLVHLLLCNLAVLKK